MGSSFIGITPLFAQHIPIKNTVEKMATWLKKENPNLYEDLARGATKKDFDKLSKAISTDLPESFINLYSIHNGQNNDQPGVLLTQEFLSISEIIKQWKIWKELYDDGQFSRWDSKADVGIQNE